MVFQLTIPFGTAWSCKPYEVLYFNLGVIKVVAAICSDTDKESSHNPGKGMTLLPVFRLFDCYRFIVMRRVFMILAILYLMRCVTMFVTVLPVSSHKYYCSPKMNTTNGVVILKRAWQLMIGFGLSINGKHTFCGDYIYSGHTVILVMSYLIIAECESFDPRLYNQCVYFSFTYYIAPNEMQR
jgi:hypothetical protein